jgi:hypothetical protein
MPRNFASLRLPALAFLLILGHLAACGGTELEAGAGADGGYTEPDGAVCVDIELSSYDRSCIATSDCTAISTGPICPGSCACGDAPVNKSGVARYEAAISGIRLGSRCLCIDEGTPTCVGGSCILCPFGSKVPGCTDGGASSDGGSESDAARCVDVELSTFDPSCNTSSDCVSITAGEVCSGECLCGGDSAINQSGLNRYEAEISGLKFADCDCPVSPMPQCIHGQCTMCGPGTAGSCPDGG